MSGVKCACGLNCERVTPGWEWLGYRTWRCAGAGWSTHGVPSPIVHRYRVVAVLQMRRLLS